jgi:hypothetical protein
VSELEATLPPADEVQAPPPAKPTLADQVAAIDAIEVAARVCASSGTRAAIGASAAEIIAMAAQLLQLVKLADLTFDMLRTANALQDENNPDQQRRLRHAVRLQIGDVGAALEALGYRDEQPPAKQEENSNGQG